MSPNAVELGHVSKHFRTPAGQVVALDGFSLRVAIGERIALVGQTGSGKSTALSLMIGLQDPSAGEVRVLGVDPFRAFQSLEGRTSVVFQQDRLLPWLTALDNAAFGLAMLRRPVGEQIETARDWLERLGLSDAESAYPHELSGGMRQRVAVARAMAVDPEVLFADEAFSSLDELTAEEVRGDLLRVLESTGVTTVLVTHSIREAVSVAHRVVVLESPGRVLGEVDVADAGSTLDAELAVRGLLVEAHGSIAAVGE
jgi:NitT/TauT family transport system ATP-binding protein